MTTSAWSDSLDNVDWHELSAPYRAAPLGNKDAAHLKKVFGNSLYRCFVREDDRLVELSKGHKKIILYAVPGKEPFYRKAGFRRMRTAMAIFENQAQACEHGYVDDT